MKTKMYDPDEFVLDKKTWLEIIDQVNQYWSLNDRGNTKLKMSLDLLRWWLSRQEDKDVKAIWKLIIKFIDHIRYQNVLRSQILNKEFSDYGMIMLQINKHKKFIDLKESVFGY